MSRPTDTTVPRGTIHTARCGCGEEVRSYTSARVSELSATAALEGHLHVCQDASPVEHWLDREPIAASAS